MSDFMRIERSHRPWEPAHGATLIETLNYYDQPLSGIIEQDGSYYLFDCVAGHLDDRHLWCYRHLTDAELDAVRSSEPGEPARQLLAELLTEGPFVVAVADDEGGILGAHEVDNLEPDTLRTAVDLILDEFRVDTARRSELASQFTERLLNQAS